MGLRRDLTFFSITCGHWGSPTRGWARGQPGWGALGQKPFQECSTYDGCRGMCVCMDAMVSFIHCLSCCFSFCHVCVCVCVEVALCLHNTKCHFTCAAHGCCPPSHVASHLQERRLPPGFDDDYDQYETRSWFDATYDQHAEHFWNVVSFLYTHPTCCMLYGIE